MGKRVGLLAGLLVLSLGSGVVAQPSPEPPPWFGGRVEMPEHGFAVTVPDGWVAFDLAADLGRQVDAALERSDPGVAALYGDGQALRASLDNADTDDLVMADLAAGPSCAVGVWPTLGVDVRDYAEFIHDDWVDRFDGFEVDVGPPVAVDIPAGPAFVMDITLPDTGQERGRVIAKGWVDGGDRNTRLSLNCFGGARPEDDWLSIAETIEFLPAEE